VREIIAVAGILLALSRAETHLSVQPWVGGDFQTTSTQAAKYRLQVIGAPNTTIHLRAVRVASGWLAAFCTPKFCAPERVDANLPSSGQAVFQFELIRESDGAPRESGATIVGDGGVYVVVPAAHRE
jgi:hypothetical protein